jgi:hypothetical protein
MSHGDRWSIVIAAWLWCASPALAEFQDGNGLLRECRQGNSLLCYGYIDAITDVLQSNTVNGFEACLSSNVEAGQWGGGDGRN